MRQEGIMQHTKEKVAVWLASGIPVRLVWNGRRYRVNDRPTRHGGPLDYWWHPVITHLPEPFDGWRFQAVDEAGQALMFEVRLIAGSDQWELITVYD